MREAITLDMSETGVPFVRIPGEIAWDFVEYLSNQRVHVLYSFEESRVVVRFNHTDMRTARELVDMWVHAEKREEAMRSRPSREAQPAMAATRP